MIKALTIIFLTPKTNAPSPSTNALAMASSLKNLSTHTLDFELDLTHKRIAVVVSEYHTEITGALYEGVVSTLLQAGMKPEQLLHKSAPGAYELVLCAQRLCMMADIDAVICLGCVIQGETRHFDFICHAVADGLMQVSLKYDKPVIFGVLTPNTLEQALDRAGGKHGNKGVEAAVAALKMLAF